MPARFAVTGGAPLPDLGLAICLIGKENCLRRFDRAREYIKARVWGLRINE